jgi:acyl dehydratase
MRQNYFTPQTVESVIGQTFTSDWFLIDQRRISDFGAATEDSDPHHVDPQFAAAHSPWGKTISFGFLTLSMLTAMLYQVNRYPLDGDAKEGYPANYGFKDVRFVAPVPVDSRIRGHFTVGEVSERRPGQKLFHLHCSVEIEDEAKPALTATWECLWIVPLTVTD